MSKRVYGYVRVSSKEQNEGRQIESIKEYCEDKGLDIDGRNILVDKQSGKDFNRPSYQTLKTNLLRKGDILLIKELDRLGRDMEKIKEEWESLLDMGVEIVVIDTEILNTSNKSDLEKTLISNIVFELLSYLAEKERLKIRSRQKEGIKLAKENGKHLGRPKINYNTITQSQRDIIKEYYPIWKAKKITAIKFMDIVDLKTNTFYKIMKEYKQVSETNK